MFLIRTIVTMVSILIIAYLFPGIIRVDGSMPALAAAFVLGLVNAVIKPVLVVLTLPLTFLTFGFFLLVLNGLLLGLVAALVPGFYVAGLTGAVIGSVLISIVSWILSLTITPQ